MDFEQLDKIKRRLGLELNDTTEDDLLNDMYEDAESYFKSFTGAAGVAPQYTFMLENVVYKLYGRKGSESVKSEKIDGYSVTYDDLGNLFEPYLAILEKDFKIGTVREKGKVTFL